MLGDVLCPSLERLRRRFTKVAMRIIAKMAVATPPTIIQMTIEPILLFRGLGDGKFFVGAVVVPLGSIVYVGIL